MINWNEPTNKPSNGERVVVLSNRGKTATIGRYDNDERGNLVGLDDPCVVCDQTSHDVWWDDVTAWTYAPGEAVAVSLEQRIHAIIEAHEKELVEIKRAIDNSPYFNVDYLKGRAYAERGIIKDLTKAVGGDAIKAMITKDGEVWLLPETETEEYAARMACKNDPVIAVDTSFVPIRFVSVGDAVNAAGE